MTVTSPAPAKDPKTAGLPKAPPRWAHTLSTIGLYALSIGVALLLAGLLVSVTGASPMDAVQAMIKGAFGDASAISLTLDKAAPLLIVAVGTAIAVRAGLFSIGQEGQVVIGALVGATIAIFLHGPGPLVLIVALLGAALGGAAWAAVAALLYYWRGVPIVISTLLLVYIAYQVVFYAVTQAWWLQENTANVASPQSDIIREDAWLPRIGEYPGVSISSMVVLAVILAIGTHLVLERTTWGFRLRMLGLNRNAARRAGVSAVLAGSTAFMISGAFVGFTGGAMLVGGAHRLQPGISENVGWDGLLVALVARNNPIVAIPVAFFFGALRAGGGFLAATGVPRYIVDVVTAILVLAVVFPPAYQFLRREARSRRIARALATGGGAA
jgi:simple sugar transport system permease protein